MFRWITIAVFPLLVSAAQFTGKADYVLLDASVQNSAGAYVSGLKPVNFKLVDDGRVATINHFASTDRPVTIGLIVDNSGSMAEKRAEVVTAGMTFAKTSNPNDEFFVINFNSHVYAALPRGVAFTDKLAVLRSALYLGTPIGQTALYDAVAAGLQHVMEGHRDIRVLVVVSDGGDNASKLRFADLEHKIEAARVTIYTIGLLDPMDRDLNPRILKSMSKLSGGEFFEPQTLQGIEPIFDKISRDVRHRYVLGFTPDYAHDPHSLHKLHLEARDENEKKLIVHARTSYWSTP
jgi:VWFA-related protein